MTREIKHFETPKNITVNKINSYFFKKVADLFGGLTMFLYLWSVERQEHK